LLRLLPEDKRHARRFIHNILALCVAVVHTFLTYYAFHQGWLWIPIKYLHLFFFVFYSINLGVLFFVRTEQIMKVGRHELVFVETLWAQIYLLAVSVFFVDMRFVLFTPAIISLAFCSFRMPIKLVFALFAISNVGFAFGSWYRGTIGVELDFHQELTEIVMLFFISLAVVFIGRDIFSLRKALKNKNEEIKSALKRIEDIAIYDDLTNVYNKKHLFDVMMRFNALSKRKNFTYSICYLDVDNFQSINESFGHEAGDEVLVAIGKLITDTCRASDICGRFSGEEFVLVLPETDLHQAQVLAKRLNKKIKDLRFASIHYMLQVTISIGIAENHHTDTVEDLVVRAEEALELAKQTGKDRVFSCEKDLDEVAAVQSNGEADS